MNHVEAGTDLIYTTTHTHLAACPPAKPARPFGPNFNSAAALEDSLCPRHTRCPATDHGPPACCGPANHPPCQHPARGAYPSHWPETASPPGKHQLHTTLPDGVNLVAEVGHTTRATARLPIVVAGIGAAHVAYPQVKAQPRPRNPWLPSRLLATLVIACLVAARGNIRRLRRSATVRVEYVCIILATSDRLLLPAHHIWHRPMN